MQALHERLDSTIASSNVWFEKIELAQAAGKTTLDAVVA
jgi:hypothetical protein